MLVESAQSMANHLEMVLWPLGADEPHPSVAGLPYVRIERGGEYLTSSRTESHRLGSAYIKESLFGDDKGVDLIRRRLGLVKGTPIDHGRVAREVFALDPLALVHGVFFADDNWFGQPKIARAVTAFVEARGVQPAHSGGVKFDHVSNSGDKARNDRSAKEGFGNVPFPRTEFVAKNIEAIFVIDVSQIRRYRIAERQKELILAIALLEIRGLLDEGLRFRTACDLAVIPPLHGERPRDFELPERAELERLVRERIDGNTPALVGTFE
jgi:CRISPR-associated protein Csb1